MILSKYSGNSNPSGQFIWVINPAVYSPKSGSVYLPKYALLVREYILSSFSVLDVTLYESENASILSMFETKSPIPVVESSQL